MKRIKRAALWSTVVCGVVFAIWFVCRYPRIDISKVHPSLRNLDGNAKCYYSTYGDGGTMAIVLRSKSGKEIELSLSNSIEQSFSDRGDLYIGARYYLSPDAKKIVGYDHSKYVVAQLLKPSFGADANKLIYIALLTRSSQDWFEFACRADYKTVKKAYLSWVGE